MAGDKLETEELIKRTAKDLFFKEGRFGATTQEIADAAGVNRTLINYYFRSRDNLFDLIFEEALVQEQSVRDKMLYSDLPLKQKIENYLEVSFDHAKEYPYLESYIVTRLNDGDFQAKAIDWDLFFARFEADYQAEIHRGEVVEMTSIQFFLSLWSLISFPFAVQPLFKNLLKISNKEYEQLIDERKKVIMKLLFK